MRKCGKRQTELLEQLTGKRFDGNNDLRGKKRRVSLAAAFPAVRPGVDQRSAFAIWGRSVEAVQVVDRFPCLKPLSGKEDDFGPHDIGIL